MSLVSFPSWSETVTVDKWGKTFNLTAPTGFCFLSYNPSTEELHRHWHSETNRFNEDEKLRTNNEQIQI